MLLPKALCFAVYDLQTLHPFPWFARSYLFNFLDLVAGDSYCSFVPCLFLYICAEVENKPNKDVLNV